MSEITNRQLNAKPIGKEILLAIFALIVVY